MQHAVIMEQGSSVSQVCIVGEGRTPDLKVRSES